MGEYVHQVERKPRWHASCWELLVAPSRGAGGMQQLLSSQPFSRSMLASFLESTPQTPDKKEGEKEKKGEKKSTEQKKGRKAVKEGDGKTTEIM